MNYQFQLLKLARRFGFDVQRYGEHRDPYVRLNRALQRQNVDLLLDVGANIGQFGQMIRMAGYNRQIISFEPQSVAYAELESISRNDQMWTVAPRCAIGATVGETEIQIAGNSKSSSILNMTERHIEGDPKSAYVGKEKVDTTTIDEFLDARLKIEIKIGSTEYRYPIRPIIGLKIDTQGYEAEVLAGLNKWSDAVNVIYTEMSLTPLYEGGIGFGDLFQRIETRGYRCTSIEPGFTDPKTYEMLQVDATFERK